MLLSSPTVALYLPATPSSAQPRNRITIAPSSSPPHRLPCQLSAHVAIFRISPTAVAIFNPHHCYSSPAIAATHHYFMLPPLFATIASSPFSPTTASAIATHTKSCRCSPVVVAFCS
ncbi:hypothetical protein B296_00026660 [Ensete ventricosum]|uniref:Uncharacterized protein n=1 Tax=Ensete ventricosum TaxID=4639 RepID=A0A427A341_ENSVE|nr:hypothetical protein B296_00026660 [Ensete ventricosum]